MEPVGLRVREMRMRAGLTQQNLADLFYWDVKKISKIENGRQRMYQDEYEKLAEELAGVRKTDEFTIDYQPQHAIMR